MPRRARRRSRRRAAPAGRRAVRRSPGVTRQVAVARVPFLSPLALLVPRGLHAFLMLSGSLAQSSWSSRRSSSGSSLTAGEQGILSGLLSTTGSSGGSSGGPTIPENTGGIPLPSPIPFVGKIPGLP